MATGAMHEQVPAPINCLIMVLRHHSGGTVDLSQPAPFRAGRGRSRFGRGSYAGAHAAANTDGSKPKSRHRRRAKNASGQQMGERRPYRRPGSKRSASDRLTPPTNRMVAFAERLAKDKRASLPSGYDKDFDICRRFLDQHAGR